MSDEDEVKLECKVEYTDSEEPEESNWIKRAGKAKVTYPNQDIFDGTFNEEKLKEGYGVYVWMSSSEEDDGEVKEVSRYEGNYTNGKKNGIGKMVFSNKDIYEGEWVDDKMEGEGSYTYDKSKDIYSGSWKAGKKHGKGFYEYSKDKSKLSGNWSEGQFITGSWDMKSYAVYEGTFEYQKPIGKGAYKFVGGLTQKGEYIVDAPEVIPPVDGENEGETEADAEAEVEPQEPIETNDTLKTQRNIEWKADTLVRF